MFFIDIRICGGHDCPRLFSQFLSICTANVQCVHCTVCAILENPVILVLLAGAGFSLMRDLQGLKLTTLVDYLVKNLQIP